MKFILEVAKTDIMWCRCLLRSTQEPYGICYLVTSQFVSVENWEALREELLPLLLLSHFFPS